MSKGQGGAKLVELFESLSDITLTVVADFLGDPTCGGLPVALRLAEVGVAVFPVGLVGEDEAGHTVLQALHEHRISTSGISRIKSYVTPKDAGGEAIHGEHPALLNLIEHARRFVSASDGMFVCDYGIGAASPRVLNFIKSNRCVHEKTLVARSPHRLVEFEQLTAAVASSNELEQAIGIELGKDAEKLAVAAEGMRRELGSDSFIAASERELLVVNGGRKAATISSGISTSGSDIDVLAAMFTAGLATGAEAQTVAELSARLVTFFDSTSTHKRARREDLVAFLAEPKAARHLR